MNNFSKGINYIKIYGFKIFYVKLVVSILGFFYKKEIFRNNFLKAILTKFSLEKEIRIKNFLRKKITENAFENFPSLKNSTNPNKAIWVMWWQGILNAPEIVKKCIMNLKKLHPDWEVNVITKDNIIEYIDDTNKIMDMMHKNEISFTVFSDYLRMFLLDNYGGVWIDSTCFLTDKLPETILNYDIYSSKGVLPNELTPRYPITSRYQIFFIACKPNNLIIKKLHYLLFKSLIFGYSNIDYLLTYYLLEIILEDDEQCHSQYDAIPSNNHNIIQVLNKLHKPLTQEIVDLISDDTTYIFKLTYKTNEENETFQWLYDRYLNKQK